MYNIDLSGRVAIVAGGGGSGIGGCISRSLGAAGATVAVVDINVELANTAAEAVVAAGGSAVAIQADVRSRSEIETVVEHVAEVHGGIDILVNAAGGSSNFVPFQPIARVPDDDWDLIMNLNLRYVFLATRAVIPHMRHRSAGGAIVHVSSVSGAYSAPNHAAYGAAKAGVIALTRSLAVECGPIGIRVNSVAPGFIVTPATSLVGLQERSSDDRVPLGRPGLPEEVAAAVLFLASPAASYISGQTLVVDGGAHVTSPIVPSSLLGDITVDLRPPPRR